MIQINFSGYFIALQVSMQRSDREDRASNGGGCQWCHFRTLRNVRYGDVMTHRFLSALVLSFVLGAAGSLAPARADCSCEQVCSGWGVNVEGTGGGSDACRVCQSGCRDQAAISYGAIAYGPKSGAWGSSYRWDSEAKAESEAMKSCAQHGNDCEVMVWFDRKCGAVVAAEGAAAFWGLGDSEEQARADAENKCEQGGGKGCRVQASQCSK